MQAQEITYIAGHTGMVGSSLYNLLVGRLDKGALIIKSRDSVDLINQSQIDFFLKNTRINNIYMMAGLVGGIKANNSFPANFLYQNLTMNANLIHAAYDHGVGKMLVLGSACMYPVNARQPVSESALMSGFVEQTNEAYAIAKIATLKMAEMYRRQYDFDVRILIPTNMYGPGDHYDPDNSHVIPALLRKFHEAMLNDESVVEIWGSGKPMRDFLFVEDFARLSIRIMDLDKSQYQELVGRDPYLNVSGSGEVSIGELSQLIARIVGYEGQIVFDSSKPDGAPRKVLSGEKLLALGWKAETTLALGLVLAYKDFLKEYREN